MKNIRKQIDELDQKIIKLLSERMGLVKELGELKKSSGADIQDKAREAEILDHLQGIAKKEELDSGLINDLYNRIFAESRRIQE